MRSDAIRNEELVSFERTSKTWKPLVFRHIPQDLHHGQHQVSIEEMVIDHSQSVSSECWYT